ncbi:MAG: class I SAM-dependent methyltransferase [Actinomycetia bacterium]|nr:class I SAM-dependent methyltransferase [Actinomycetes bacterium]
MRTLRQVSDAPVTMVGNVASSDVARLRATGATYVDERDVDLRGRFPDPQWQKKYREVGWYRQMFLRLSIDRFMDAQHVGILDSEVFVFDNWDESRFFSQGRLKSLGWVPTVRKPEWDYRMYRGAAYLLQGLPGCEHAMEYASSDRFRRHISGVVLFSSENLAHLWYRLEKETDLSRTIHNLFNEEPELAFSDHDFYGIAADLGVFDQTDPPAIVTELLGWYDRHPDPAFEPFRGDAMWSMCQTYAEHANADSYLAYAQRTAASLERALPEIPYWNPGDRALLDPIGDTKGTGYFAAYRRQLDHTFRKRYTTMRRALDELHARHPDNATIIEVGTLRDNNVGGGHSTFKFGEYLAQFGGILHSVDISAKAVEFSQRASADYLPWIEHHVADSSEFITGFQGTIDLLYLDGLDALPGHEAEASAKQLDEIRKAYPRLSDRAVVLLDDAALPGEGKTFHSSRLLPRLGFVRVADDYQRLYVRSPFRSWVRRTIGRLSGRTPRLRRAIQKLVDGR